MKIFMYSLDPAVKIIWGMGVFLQFLFYSLLLGFHRILYHPEQYKQLDSSAGFISLDYVYMRHFSYFHNTVIEIQILEISSQE